MTPLAPGGVTGDAGRGPEGGSRVARTPYPTVLRRYAGLAATVGSAVAAGARIADPPVLRRHACAVLDALGIALDAAGAGPLRVPGTARGTLIVANHVSWLDVIAVLAVEPVPLLAKREVAEWAVVGPLTRRTGTRFIDREALRELPRVVGELAEYLGGGGSVMVFPQATTWCTAPGGPFRRATFQAALDAGAPVRPVAIDFTRNRRPSTVPAYVGGDTLTASLRRVTGADGLAVRVRSCPPLWPHGHDRRSLAAAAQAAVSGAVGRPAAVAGHAPARCGTDVPWISAARSRPAEGSASAGPGRPG
ncbi:lysophospholipid acyltransferase family protein [Streptomyces winkii]|uniref:lysophospholipid acyltransferase family protein n=1 Tax=Streptomyces winkii TaxID=3051178 RepID=UPI0028D0FE08|nr:lysophospholipid acyltransferase family protein [Streptomyces sp. DSM 40971]